MKKQSMIVILLLATVFSAAHAEVKTSLQPATTSPDSSVLEPGDAAPEFSLKGADGKTYDLKNYKDKIVVLEWFNNDCPYVNKHYASKNMQNLQEKYTNEGVVWLTISSTRPKNALTADEAKKIIKERDAKETALLLDSDGKIALQYRAKTTPHMFIIGKDGKIAYNGAIDDKPSFEKDTIATAKNYVSQALDVLLGKSKDKTITDTVTKPYGCSVKI